jgi:hypothetical protein
MSDPTAHRGPYPFASTLVIRAVREENSGWVAECTRPNSYDEEGPKRFAC